MRLGAVVLTMGNRPDELRALLESVAKQDGGPIEVVVVGNGAPLPELAVPGLAVRTVELPENVGIPAGRNVGIEAFRTDGRDGFAVDALLFLDDDGRLPRADTAELCREAFAADRELGIISFRIADPDTGVTQRRHVPRLRASDPLRSSRVTTFLGGANAVRTAVFAQVGGLPDEFFYAHEETDLAWRALDAGWLVDYRSDMILHHPTTAPARHAVYHRMVARNRVWLARRNLPAPLVPVYLGVWFLLTLARRPSLPGLRAWLGGFREGWATPCGPRRPMKWATVWRLSRLGRPPII
ncbi:glycosyltransferase family 2 protein [Streptomyces sp. NPDC020883]|uniref:glycosyltransferase family 2 protein n=1 Tax=Streptomyces sp. NPDC020883 TaxID=3365099 RepID=UPI0037940C9C